MIKFTLLLIGALTINSLNAQTWVSEPSHKAQDVRDSFVSRDHEIVIFSSIVIDENTSYPVGTAFHTLDEGASWQEMYKQDGSRFQSYDFTKIQDTLFYMKPDNSTGLADMIYSLDNGITWEAVGSGNIGVSWTSSVMSFHSFFGKVFISRDDTLMIANSDLSNLTYVNQYFGSTSFYANCGIKKIVQRGNDLFAISSPYQQVWKSLDQGITWQNISYGVYSFEDIVEDNNKIYCNVYGGKIFELDEVNNEWTLLANLGSNTEMNISGDTIISINGKHIVISTDHGANFSNVESFENYGIYDGTMNPGIIIPMLKRVNNTFIVGGFFGTMRADASTLQFQSALKGHKYSRKTFDIVLVNGDQMQIGRYGMTYKYDTPNDVWVYLGGNVEYLDGNNESAYKPQLKSYGDTIYNTYPNLVMTTDMGETWDTILDGGANFGAVPNAYMDMEIIGNDLYLGTTNDLRVTSDMGASWTILQLGSAAAMYYKNGELFHSDVNGDITYSTDYGTTFTNIHGNLPGNVMDIKVAGGTIFAVVSISAWNSGNEVWHSDNRNGTWVQDTQFVNGTTDGSSFDLLEIDNKIIAATRNDIYMTSDMGNTWDNINFNLEPPNTWESIDAYPREFANDTLYAVSNDSIYKLYLPNNITAVNEVLQSKTNLTLYPNPSYGQFNLQSYDNIQSVEIYNQLGIRVLNKAINAKQSQINLERLPKGLYLVNVVFDGVKVTKKVILK